MDSIDSGNQEPGAVPVPPAVIRPSEPRVSFLQRPAVGVLVVALLIGIGLVRIVSTYHVFNATIDEGAHLACGIQWFENSYTYDQKHTPIARISVALLPYLNGAHGYGDPSYWQEGVLVLSSTGRYWHTLTLARVGVLPFFVLCTVFIFLWTKRVYGYVTALVAAGIFTMLPVVLAHSALATTDIALAAFFTLAVYAFTRWLATPNWRTAAGFGFATGLAISTKLSTLAFLPAAMAGVLFLYFVTRRRDSDSSTQSHAWWRIGSVRGVIGQIAIGLICIFLVLWPVYRFSHTPISKLSGAPDRIAARVFGTSSSVTGGVRALTAAVQVPAPEFLSGLRDLRDINRLGARSYLFGRYKEGGWWYFYPVAIAVKTPLAVLLLAILGAILLIRNWLRGDGDWQRLVPLVAFVAPIVIAAPTRLDIGVRHVMPVFVFLSMLAAVGAVWLWNVRPVGSHDSQTRSRMANWAGPTAVIILFAWLIVSSARAHPDYLSYFNEFGGSNPSNILVISDVDWGQDLTRLSTYLSEQQVKHVSIAYDGYYDAATLGLPETVKLRCGETATGWIAIEERRARVHPECYEWIASQPLHAYVGKTMRVYYLPEPASDAR